MPDLLRHAAAALAFAAAVVVPGAARAGAGVVETRVSLDVGGVAVDNVSYARGTLLTHAVYTVSIANRGGNTVNAIRFTGRTSVTDAAETAAIVAPDGSAAGSFTTPGGALCTISSDRRGIECAIGTLVAGAAHPSFQVFVMAPAKVDGNGVADLPGQDRIAFSGQTFYGEGTAGSNPRRNSVRDWNAPPVTLGTANSTLVRSVVLAKGGKFFTGASGVATAADLFATTVSVPAGTDLTRAEIAESASGSPNCTNFDTCYGASLAIPGNTLGKFTPFLTVVLRMHEDNIKPGTRIEGVLLSYFFANEAVPAPIGLCASPTTISGTGVPCIAERKYYKNDRVPGWTPALDGSFEWTLINDGNGRIIVD